MSRLIDADKINFNEVFVGASDFARDTREAAQSLIDAQPTIEAVPVVHGEWVPHKRMARSPLVMNYACSVCGKDGNQTNFCPNCGANMKGGVE